MRTVKSSDIFYASQRTQFHSSKTSSSLLFIFQLSLGSLCEKLNCSIRLEHVHKSFAATREDEPFFQFRSWFGLEVKVYSLASVTFLQGLLAL